MISKIKLGMGNTKGIMKLLIPFNVIIESDVGLLSLIYKEYMDESVFNKDYFLDKSVRDLTLDLYRRADPNPLSLCIRDEYKDLQDDFYQQFMEREYDKILDMSVFTEIYSLIARFNLEKEITLTLLCNTEEERNILLEYDNTKQNDIIMIDTIKPEDIKKQWNQYYFKTLLDVTPFAKHMKRKTIYIAGYRFNLNDKQDGLADDDLVTYLIFRNTLNIMHIYNMKLLKGEEDE